MSQKKAKQQRKEAPATREIEIEALAFDGLSALTVQRQQAMAEAERINSIIVGHYQALAKAKNQPEPKTGYYSLAERDGKKYLVLHDVAPKQ